MSDLVRLVVTPNDVIGFTLLLLLLLVFVILWFDALWLKARRHLRKFLQGGK